MATTSEVKSGLDRIAGEISSQRAVILKAKTNAANASTFLDAIPVDHGDVIDTINAFGTSDLFEAHAKAEFAKLAAEFQSLKAAADAMAATDLGE